MHTLRFLILLGFSLAALPRIAWSDSDLRLNPEQLQRVTATLHAEGMEQSLTEIEALGNRFPGEPGVERAGAYVEARLSAMGYEILSRQRFGVTVPRDQGSRIQWSGSGRAADREIPIHAFWPNYVTPPFLPPDGLEARMVYVGEGGSEDFDGMPIAGRDGDPGAVVLMAYNSGDRWLRAAALGASAVVFLPDPDASTEETLKKISDTPVQFPRFYLADSEAGERLRDVAREAGTVVLRGGMAWETVESHNLVAWLPATVPPGADVETLLVNFSMDAASLIPGITPGGQSAENLAASLQTLQALADPSVLPDRHHNLLVVVDSGSVMASRGLAAFAGVVRDLNAMRVKEGRGPVDLPGDRQRFLARKMADIDPWLDAHDRSLRIRLSRVEQALDWLEASAGMPQVSEPTLEDAESVTPSDLIPQARAADWLRGLLMDRAKQQQIHTLNQTLLTERAAGFNAFTPDGDVSDEVRMWRRRKAYYTNITAAGSSEELLMLMRTHALSEEDRGDDDLTVDLLLRELRLRRDELAEQAAWMSDSLALREQLASMDITRAVRLDISSGDSALTVSRGEVGGDRSYPAPQDFEWSNSLLPLIQRNFERISLLAGHALSQERPGEDGRAPVAFDFVGRGDRQRQVAPAPHGPFNIDLSLAGVSSLNLVTGNDMRLRRLGPGNRIRRTSREVNHLVAQSRTASLLMAHLLLAPELFPHYERNTPWVVDVNGVVVKQDERAGPFPQLPVEGCVVTIPGPRILGSAVMTLVTLADSQGLFRFEGYPGGVGTAQVQAFRTSARNGMLEYAPDATMASRGGYDTTFRRLDKEVFKRVVVFEGAAIQLYDAVDPMLAQPLARPGNTTSLRLFEGKGGTLDSQYVHRPTAPSPVFFAMTPPRSEIKIVVEMGGFGNRMLLLGDQSEQATGEGYAVHDFLNLWNAAGLAAEDLFLLNDDRLRLLSSKGVKSNVALTLHEEAKADRARLEEARAMNQHSLVRYLERGLWGRGLRAYPDILDTTDQALLAVVILLAFLAPWSVFMERVFIQSGSIRMRILGAIACFTAAFILLYFLHPAFQISQTPVMILIAYLLATLACLAMSVLMSRYSGVMRKWRENVGGVHQSDISRVGAFMVAFNMGLSNMAKRRLRTVLSIVMVALLSFSVMTFTSIEPYRDVRRIQVGESGSAPYDGVMFRLYNWGVIDAATADNFVGDLGPGVQSVRRMWHMNLPPGSMLGIEGEGSHILLERADAGDEEGSRFHTARFLLGFEQAEAAYSGLPALVRGSWLSGAEDEIILPLEMAADFGITEADVADTDAPPRIRLANRWLRVIGLFDSGEADRLRDISGHGLSHVDFFLSGIQPGLDPEADIRALTYPVGDEVNIMMIPFRFGAIVPNALLAEMGGDIVSVAASFSEEVDEAARITDLMARFAMNLYAAIERTPYLLKSAAARSVDGAWKILLPLLLVVLIMVNLMMGTVDERRGEIKMLGAVGLAPRHVSILYLAESCALGVMGVVFGVLLGLIVSVLTRDMNVGVDVNYASVPTILMGVLVLLVVIGATLIPASRAARLATPSGAEKWTLPDSSDGVVRLTLPFTMTRQSGTGVFAFLMEYLDGHRESTSPDFRAENLSGMIETVPGDSTRLVLQADAWLAPYDMRVSQDVWLRLCPESEGRLFRVEYEARQRSGELSSWNKANFVFIDLLRQQFLIYRTLSDEQKKIYVRKAAGIYNKENENGQG